MQDLLTYAAGFLAIVYFHQLFLKQQFSKEQVFAHALPAGVTLLQVADTPGGFTGLLQVDGQKPVSFEVRKKRKGQERVEACDHPASFRFGLSRWLRVARVTFYRREDELHMSVLAVWKYFPLIVLEFSASLDLSFRKEPFRPPSCMTAAYFFINSPFSSR
jgi:hypothetical protein